MRTLSGPPTVDERPPSPRRGSGAVPGLHDREPGTVKVWAFAGTVMLAWIAQGWIRWIGSDDFRPVSRGPDRIPTFDLVMLRTLEVASLAIMVWLVWHTIVRPLRRERRIGFDGKLLLAGMFGYFVDQFINIYNVSFTFNAYAVNRGSWGNFIPGMHAPLQGRAAEGLLWAWAMYTYFVVAAALLGSKLLRFLERRYPAMSSAGLWAITYAVFFVADILIELPLFVHQGVYAYAGVPKALSLFAGRSYQFPMYEPVFVALVCFSATWLRESRDDRGRSRVERGVDELRIGRRAKEAVSFAAITGFTISLLTLAYFIPFSWMSMQSDSYPALPSYLKTNAYCGTPGTGRPCPSQLVDRIPPAGAKP